MTRLLGTVLEAVGENATTYLRPDSDGERLAAQVVAAVASGLSAQVANGIAVRDLVTRDQLADLIGLALGRVAQHPEQLLGDPDGDAAETVVAMVVSAVAQSLAASPQAVLSGDHMLDLVDDILLEVAETALAHPDLLDQDAVLRDLIGAVVAAMRSSPGAKVFPERFVGEVLARVLERVHANAATYLRPDTPQEQLVANVLKAVAAGLSAPLASGATWHDVLSRDQLLALVTVALDEVARHPDQLLGAPDDDVAKSALAQVIAAVARSFLQDPGRFAAEDALAATVRETIDVALGIVVDHPELVGDHPMLQELVVQTIGAIRSPAGRRVFPEDLTERLLLVVLDGVREHATTYWRPESPQEQLAAGVLAAVAAGFGQQLAGGGPIKELLSRENLVELVSITLDEVARNPHQLLDDADGDLRKTAVAQIIGSLARSLGDDPSRFVDGDGFVELLELTLQTAILNVDDLLDLSRLTARSNGMFKALHQIVAAIAEDGDPRRLVSRDVFLEIAEHALPVVSANLPALIGDDAEAVKQTVRVSLGLAQDALVDRNNGANLPVLIEALLVTQAWDELDLNEINAVLKFAQDTLRAAA